MASSFIYAAQYNTPPITLLRVSVPSPSRDRRLRPAIRSADNGEAPDLPNFKQDREAVRKATVYFEWPRPDGPQVMWDCSRQGKRLP